MNILVKLLLSFKYAIRGISYCILHCRNFRIHIVAVIYVLYFSKFYNFDKMVYVLLCILFAIILSAEAMNTALENTCDAVSDTFTQKIQYAKDCAAASVLITALAAVIIAVILFWDLSVFSNIAEYFILYPVRILILILSIAVSALFIFFEDVFNNGK